VISIRIWHYVEGKDRFAHVYRDIWVPVVVPGMLLESIYGPGTDPVEQEKTIDEIRYDLRTGILMAHVSDDVGRDGILTLDEMLDDDFYNEWTTEYISSYFSRGMTAAGGD
jgi:hypothetical protein